MRTILGTPYTPPTPEELEAAIRRAHRERAQAMRDLWSSLFWWQRRMKAEPPKTYASLRSAL
jgi:hypothetical protein